MLPFDTYHTRLWLRQQRTPGPKAEPCVGICLLGPFGLAEEPHLPLCEDSPRQRRLAEKRPISCKYNEQRRRPYAPIFTCLFKQRLQVVPCYKRITKPLLIQEVNYIHGGQLKSSCTLAMKEIQNAALIRVPGAGALKQEGRIFMTNNERIIYGKNLIIY